MCQHSLKLSRYLHFPLKTLPEPHHYPHFTDRKQNQRQLKSFTQGHTANNHGGRSWNSNCLVPRIKFFLWNIYLSYNPIVMFLLIFIIHDFLTQMCFWGFVCFQYWRNAHFSWRKCGFLTKWPMKFPEEFPPPPPYTPSPHLPHPSHSPPQAGFPGWFSLSWKASWKRRGSCPQFK